MTTITAKVIKDSIYNGHRLTTLELHYPRIILAELNTHRQLSKSTSSSRAIPVEKIIQNVKDDPYIPIKWGMNERGMSSSKEAVYMDKLRAENYWLEAMRSSIKQAENLITIGIHKQFANRILEPWSHVNTIISGTEWDNFFKLRISDNAQPEMRKLAEEIKRAMDNSSPEEKRLTNDISDKWHIPYITDEEADLPLETKLKVSVARCARVSYKSNTSGKLSTVSEDTELFDRLYSNGHWSPFEHIALPTTETNTANFVGWKQYRKFLES